MGISAEINHVEDGLRNGRTDRRDEHETNEIADSRHDDRSAWPHRTR